MSLFLKKLLNLQRVSCVQVPATADDWLEIADEFKTKWNYPCCIGALDGKHVAIQQPADSGSEFYNYKHFFRVLLLALVDANYKFIYVDVGVSGRAGDAGMFAESSLKQSLDNNTMNLPPAETIQGIPNKIHYHIVADDAASTKTFNRVSAYLQMIALYIAK